MLQALDESFHIDGSRVAIQHFSFILVEIGYSMRFLTSLIPACVLMAQSSPPPDGRSLLMRSVGSILTADTVRLEGTESSAMVAPASQRRFENSFSITLASGGRMRLQRTSGDSTVLQISDGSTLWSYRSADKTYSQRARRQSAAAPCELNSGGHVNGIFPGFARLA
jgi:hypothetical protein